MSKILLNYESVLNDASDRSVWLDWMRVIATLLVITLHICVRPLSHYGETDDINWYLSLVLRNIAAIAVPLFFMMSGYLYLSKKHIDVTDFLTRRITKIIIPFLCWSYFWLLYTHGFRLENITLTTLFQPFSAPTMFHLWFMYPLIGLYIVIPLIHSFIISLSQQLRLYSLICWLLLVGVADYFSRFGLAIFGFQPQLVTIWIGYFIAGYIVTSLILRPALMWFISICILLTMMGVTYYLTQNDKLMHEQMYEPYAAHVMVFSCAIFWLAFHYRRFFTTSPLLIFLSGRSFVAYLSHPVFMIKAEQYFFPSLQHLPFYYIPLMIGLVTIASYALASIIYALRLQRIFG